MDDLIKFDYPTEIPRLIKVVGVGGGGGNAVTKMYDEGYRDVSYVLCNTDAQALKRSTIPNRVQLGLTGLGAGGRPEVGRTLAEESFDKIKNMLSDGTQMVFITAGMGGGTGTGASPVVARIAKEMNILTIGIVTIPFMFEDKFKIVQALKGVEAIKENVDALLVINNERLIDLCSDMSLPEAFNKADDTLSIAARSISEIITIPGYINLDFADVKTILKDGGVAVMSSGLGKGDNRVSQAIKAALDSPLLNNNDVFKAKKILFNISFGNILPMKTKELIEIQNFMAKFDSEIEVIWGTAFDENLVDEIKITILASGYSIENIISINKEIKEEPIITADKDIPYQLSEKDQIKIEQEERNKRERKLIEKYYGKGALRQIGKEARPHPFIFTSENIDDNFTIEEVINNPAFNRSSRVMIEIARKAEKKRQEIEEGEEELKTKN